MYPSQTFVYLIGWTYQHLVSDWLDLSTPCYLIGCTYQHLLLFAASIDVLHKSSESSAKQEETIEKLKKDLEKMGVSCNWLLGLL